MDRHQHHRRHQDFGKEPLVVNINQAAKRNSNYRTALWTGKHLQITLMSIRVGGDIGLEMHATLDQFLRVESGCGLVKMGRSKDNLAIQHRVDSNYATKLQVCKDRLDDVKAQMETAKTEVKKPFPQEAELNEKMVRLNEINIALNLDERDHELVDGVPDEGDSQDQPRKKERDRGR